MVSVEMADTRRRSRAITPLRITVLMGGPSAEREVSLDSGEAIARALELLGHQVRRADVGPDDLTALDEPADMMFVALHGTWGEDGQLQAILEERALRYTGCDAASSALAMDKVRAKRRMRQIGVPTPRFEHVTMSNAKSVGSEFGLPAVVKPVAEGSSVDCLIVRDRPALSGALGSLIDRYGDALVEAYIDGEELTVGMLGGVALPVCQIRPASEFYDYHAKYEAEDTEYVFEINLPPDVLGRVQSMSVRVFEALGCRDMARIDWVVESSSGQPFCLEANTIPGFTSHSLLPKAAARAGIGFADLCQRLVDLTMAR